MTGTTTGQIAAISVTLVLESNGKFYTFKAISAVLPTKINPLFALEGDSGSLVLQKAWSKTQVSEIYFPSALLFARASKAGYACSLGALMQKMNISKVVVPQNVTSVLARPLL